MKPDITNPTLILSSKIRLFGLTAGLFLALIFLPGTPVWGSPQPSVQIHPEDLHSSSPDGFVILDSRSRWSYLLGHIPGARFLGNWEDYTLETGNVRGKLNTNKGFLVRRLRELGIAPSNTLVIYGDSGDKWRTDGRFFWMFEYLGFKNVLLLAGGYEAWDKSGFPIERGSGPDVTPSNIQANDLIFNPNVIADQAWIQKRLGQPEIKLIDNRERSEYDGATPYGSPRGGHIPGAIHIDWRDFFTRDGFLKSRSDLATLIARYGIKPEHQVVVYCTGGVRSAMAYFVFRELGYQVRNYDGSWWDWSHSPTLPIEQS